MRLILGYLLHHIMNFIFSDSLQETGRSYPFKIYWLERLLQEVKPKYLLFSHTVPTCSLYILRWLSVISLYEIYPPFYVRYKSDFFV
jgi:hypothetical protein